MAIIWTKDLSVGINRIDEQHQILIDKTNQLFEAGKNGKSKEYVGQMLDFLEDYTKQHFRDEETYMTSIKYPEVSEHKQHHADFVAQLQQIKSQFNESGGNISVIISVNQMVINWLTRHILTVDKKIAQFVKSTK